jgi:hypothetical protein
MNRRLNKRPATTGTLVIATRSSADKLHKAKLMFLALTIATVLAIASGSVQF